MKKLFAGISIVFALALLTGCTEDPVEEELVTEEAEQTLESAPEGEVLQPETGPDPTGTTMTGTTMSDTTMTDTTGPEVE